MEPIIFLHDRHSITDGLIRPFVSVDIDITDINGILLTWLILYYRKTPKAQITK